MTLTLLSRSAGRFLLVFPGWAFDHRVFLEKKWGYDLIACDNPDPASVRDEVLDFIGRERPFPLSILGWSMGGLLASALFGVPEFAGRVERAFVMCLPRAFDPVPLGKLRRQLLSRGVRGLENFYRLAFRGNRGFADRFRSSYEPGLLGSLDPEALLKQLDFMETARVPDSFFSHPKVRLFYSLGDPLVAAGSLPGLRPDTVTVPSTHVPFWYDEVVDAVNQG